MAGRGGKLDRFFRRRPGLYFVIRLLVFGGGLSLLLWYFLDTGTIPRRRYSIHQAENPAGFWLVIALFVIGMVIATAASTLVFLRQKKLLPVDWKPFGIDFRR